MQCRAEDDGGVGTPLYKQRPVEEKFFRQLPIEVAFFSLEVQVFFSDFSLLMQM